MGVMGGMGRMGIMGGMGRMGDLGIVGVVGDVDALGGIGTWGVECDDIALFLGSTFYLLLVAYLGVRGAKPFGEPCSGIVY